jgi:hypothetical protein
MTTTSNTAKRARHRRKVLRALGWVIILGIITVGGWYMIFMPGKSWSAVLPPLSEQEQLVRDNLKRHVDMLAGQIGERNVSQPEALAAAASYIRNALGGAGYQVRIQPFESSGQTVQNIEVELPGTGAEQDMVIVGAHYDSVPGGPGANDNASGVAALLEIARHLAGKSHARTIRLVAFVNEEQPFSNSDEMGSRVYAERSRERGEQIKVMVSLETVGFYTDQPGTQHYPFPFSYFYPDTANFVGFVGNLASWRLVRQAVGAFRKSAAFPSEGVAAPAWIRGVGWSDHASFWKAGYPAMMITDTAFFRYPHYHRPTDTPEKLDYNGLARVTRGVADVVAALADN